MAYAGENVLGCNQSWVISHVGTARYAGGQKRITPSSPPHTPPLQVNGKTRAVLEMPEGASEEAALAAALADPAVSKHVAGKAQRKRIYVPGKILNIVV